MKKIATLILYIAASAIAYAQTVTGTGIDIQGTSSGTSSLVQEYLSANIGGNGVIKSSFTQTSSINSLNTTTSVNGTPTAAGNVQTYYGAVSIDSSDGIWINSAPLIPGTSTIDVNNSNEIYVDPTTIRLTATNSRPDTNVQINWGGANGFTANSSGVKVNSLSNVDVTSTDTTITSTTNTIIGTTNNIQGDTNINTSGNGNTVIGNVGGTGSISLISGNNSIAIQNSGISITGDTNVTGNVNLSGNLISNGSIQGSTITSTGNASIGGSLTVSGGVTTPGQIQAGSLATTGNATIGGNLVVTGNISTTNQVQAESVSTTGNSTVGGNLTVSGSTTLNGTTSISNGTLNMNNSKITNVASGTITSDAVNYGQLVTSINSLQATTNSQIAAISTQMNQMQSEYRSGLAGMAAVNSIPSLTSTQTANFGVGIGGFGGYTGIAAGANIRINETAVIKASIANSGGQTTGGAGLSVGF